MDTPTLLPIRSIGGDTQVLPAYLPVPGFGVLPVNAFLIEAAEPVLVDTGLAALREEFLAALRDATDLEALRWIWLTHVDADHVGNLAAVLAEAPNARVVTTYLGMGKMGMHGLPLDRAHLLNPGQSLDLGDRRLEAFRPPSFDAPETTGCFDTRTGSLFSSDCFGALLDAPARDAAEIDAGALAEGLVAWATVDAPWLAALDPRQLAGALDAVRRFEPARVLSSHLPPAEGMTETLLGHLAAARDAPPFVGPDQAALERMLRAA